MSEPLEPSKSKNQRHYYQQVETILANIHLQACRLRFIIDFNPRFDLTSGTMATSSKQAFQKIGSGSGNCGSY